MVDGKRSCYMSIPHLLTKPLNFLLQFKTQVVGVLAKGTPMWTPHYVKPSLKYVSLNSEVDSAHVHE